MKGLLSEKDYIMNLDHGAFCPSDIVASSIMTPKLVSCSVDTPVLECVGTAALPLALAHSARRLLPAQCHRVDADTQSAAHACAGPGVIPRAARRGRGRCCGI